MVETAFEIPILDFVYCLRLHETCSDSGVSTPRCIYLSLFTENGGDGRGRTLHFSWDRENASGVLVQDLGMILHESVDELGMGLSYLLV